MPSGTPWRRADAPEPVLTVAEAAYLAGFFDAEGSVYRNGRDNIVIVQVANQNRAIVDAFRVFGGSVIVSKRKGTLIPGGYAVQMDLWQWRGYQKSAELLERAIGPYLRQKSIRAVLDDVPVVGIVGASGKAEV